MEACRTCGIFFLTSSNLLRYLFENEPEILLVRKELESWKVRLNEDDAFPNYICTICLLEFHRIFKFQTSVIETQLQLQQLYNLQQENIQKIKIKTEICEDSRSMQKPCVVNASREEPNVCAFVYVDDLSDTDEYDNQQDRNITPFKVPHVPIKDEIIEEAYIPKTEETLAPEMSVLALNQGKDQQNQPKQEIPAAGIQCHLCLHVAEDQQQYRQHLLRIHETKPMECHVCGKQFPPGTTETRLKYHMKWHRINKHIKCSQCGFHCPSRDVLNEHMRAVHTKTPCKICGKLLFPRKMRLHIEKHRKMTESTQKLDCPYCASYFATDDERNQHILLFHNASNDELSMSSFKMSPTAAEAHGISLNLEQSDSETPASSCETSSTTIASFSPSDKNEKFLDDTTDESFEEASGELDDENNTKDYSDETEIDDYSVDNENTADANEDQIEEMQFACAQCPESFTRVEQLIAHAEMHTDKFKPFECNVCGKVFELKFSLNRHMKKHKNTTL